MLGFLQIFRSLVLAIGISTVLLSLLSFYRYLQCLTDSDWRTGDIPWDKLLLSLSYVVACIYICGNTVSKFYDPISWHIFCSFLTFALGLPGVLRMLENMRNDLSRRKF